MKFQLCGLGNTGQAIVTVGASALMFVALKTPLCAALAGEPSRLWLDGATGALCAAWGDPDHGDWLRLRVDPTGDAWLSKGHGCAGVAWQVPVTISDLLNAKDSAAIFALASATQVSPGLD